MDVGRGIPVAPGWVRGRALAVIGRQALMRAFAGSYGARKDAVAGNRSVATSTS